MENIENTLKYIHFSIDYHILHLIEFTCIPDMERFSQMDEVNIKFFISQYQLKIKKGIDTNLLLF